MNVRNQKVITQQLSRAVPVEQRFVGIRNAAKNRTYGAHVCFWDDTGLRAPLPRYNTLDPFRCRTYGLSEDINDVFMSRMIWITNDAYGVGRLSIDKWGNVFNFREPFEG